MSRTTIVARAAAALTIPILLLCGTSAQASECDALSLPVGEVIWCDSFEDEDLPASGNWQDNYFNFTDTTGGQRHGRSTNEAHDGSFSLRHAWLVGEVNPGWAYRSFGRTPLTSQSHSQTDFREVYWRFFVKYPAGTTSFPEKVTRGIIYASPNWAQAMIAHVWTSFHGASFLKIDPASGTDAAGNLKSTKYNDDPNLRWLGSVDASIPIATGTWQCHEVHVALNSPGQNDGVFELWIDGQLAASRDDLNWVGAYDDYGINAIMLESYWNGGAPQATERYLDSFVIATGPIGCATAVAVRPNPPTQLVAN